MSYSVTEHGSHPDLGNDDCWTGSEYDSLKEAILAYEAQTKDSSTEYILLEGDDGTRMIRKNPLFYKPHECREYAMQVGMGLGIQAYNDALGY